MTESGGESDATLVRRALAGEDDAFALLMGRHKQWVYRFVRRYVGNADDAYDVLQETFFSAWLALSRYQPERPFEAWLRRIALNKCRDRARRDAVRRVFSRLAGEEGEPEMLPDLGPSPEAAAATDQEVAQLERSIATLPRSLKEPLLLTALEGLSHQQAGELLGLNAKAVEMRIYRARERLAALRGARRGPAR
ncbi:MAG TPA: RNA polymerase sigma factor [Steroidobacteraceae bacterium]|nr:RNA polymerase sigma factor [Steroidobacteraceae bacterium]